MKNKSIIIIASVTVIIIAALITVAALTNNKSMAAIHGTCMHDDDLYATQQTDSGHNIYCINPNCPNCDHELVDNHQPTSPIVVNEECTGMGWYSNGYEHYQRCIICSRQFNLEAHTGGTHANGGVCVECDIQYQNHVQGPSVQGYVDKTETTHTPAYRCAAPGCFELVNGTPENHSGGTHDNNGICAACNYQYQLHEQSTQIVSCTDITETTHTPTYACTYEGCTSTFEGNPEPHTGGTHENGGVCTACEQQYQTHSQGIEVANYIDITETTHTPTYVCTYENCTGVFTGTPEEHTGGTHENGGQCTLCGEVYQTHSQSTTLQGYAGITELQHTPVYTCTYEGCTGTYNGTPELHTGGTHENGGQCTQCAEVYQTHGQGTEVVEYIEKNATTHTPKYGCTYEGCTSTYIGEPEAHTGGTHENGGQCTQCAEVYQTHGQGTEVVDYIDITSTSHKPTYGCTCEGCTVVYPGTAENHIYNTTIGNGECTVCGYTCTHPDTTQQHDTTYHWDKCSECGAVLNKVEHQYDQNGDCICGAHTSTNNPEEPGENPEEPGENPGEDPEEPGENPGEDPEENPGETSEEPEENPGETSEEPEENPNNQNNNSNNANNNTNNSNNDKVNTNTAEEKEDAEEKSECKHEKVTKKSNYTYHWDECNSCGATLNKTKHTYKDGKCTVCGYACVHSNTEWKSNADEHWQVCKECGTVVTGTKEQHSFSNGQCTKCGATDGTVKVASKLPNTGATTIVMSSIAMVTIAGASFVGIKRYKGV